jgi:uncharacterized protein YneF (UPF0154 family)
MALIIAAVFTVLLIGTIIILMFLDNKRMEKLKKTNPKKWEEEKFTETRVLSDDYDYWMND